MAGAKAISHLFCNLICNLTCNPDDGSVVVAADVDLPALGVGEAAYPFEILVSLGLFPFDVLLFWRGLNPLIAKRCGAILRNERRSKQMRPD